MEKRYQVFISSTFADLEEERKEVMEAIISLDCFPAGMEMFPAADIEQFEYIKTIIDQSDYYVLVIAGRYGSLSDDGKSFTEKEYEYAREKGIPVLVFAKKDIENIPASQTDNDPKMKEKLLEFRENAMKNRLAKFWDEKMELKYKVHDSLSKAFKMNPRDGWVKGDIITNTEILINIEKLRKEKESLEKRIGELTDIVNKKEKNEDLAKDDDLFNIEYEYSISTPYFTEQSNTNLKGDIDISWNEIFMIWAEIIRDGLVIDDDLINGFKIAISKYEKADCGSFNISYKIFNIIKYQLEALELLKIDMSSGYEMFSLTDKGKKKFRESLIMFFLFYRNSLQELVRNFKNINNKRRLHLWLSLQINR